MKTLLIAAVVLSLAGCAARGYGTNGAQYSIQTENDRQVTIAYNASRLPFADVQAIADGACARYRRTAVYAGELPGAHYIDPAISFDIGRIAIFRCVA